MTKDTNLHIELPKKIQHSVEERFISDCAVFGAEPTVLQPLDAYLTTVSLYNHQSSPFAYREISLVPQRCVEAFPVTTRDEGEGQSQSVRVSKLRYNVLFVTVILVERPRGPRKKIESIVSDPFAETLGLGALEPRLRVQDRISRFSMRLLGLAAYILFLKSRPRMIARELVARILVPIHERRDPATLSLLYVRPRVHLNNARFFVAGLPLKVHD